MKNPFRIALLIVGLTSPLLSQTNTFPSSGDVGIGTTSPVVPLDVKVASNFHFGAFVNTASATSIGAYNDGFSAWQPLSINPGGQVWFMGGNVGIGTTSPTHKLSVNGAIRAHEVIVDTGWSDYVFADDYRLAPLSEIEMRIKAERHLPGIPSAQEVADHGVSMGEMQAKLLAKIEELTLHVIAQEKRVQTQEKRTALLENQNEALRDELALLKQTNPIP